MTSATVLQYRDELAWFANLLASEGVRSYLEVGAKFGGSVEAVAKALPSGSRIVAIDLPNGTKRWSDSERALKRVMAKFIAQGRDGHVIWGDSTNQEVVERAHKLGPYDAVFIDANHTLPYVTADWRNYGPLGRIVAFHDIAWHRGPEWKGDFRIDVPAFWNDLKTGYRHVECKLDPTGKDNGIGVLWRC